jgi:hypothetical protein
MNAQFAQPVAVDLLGDAFEYTRRSLDRTKPINERVRIFWAAVVGARDLGATDVVRDGFMQLATDVGLVADLGPHAQETIEHLIRWGLFARNPFGRAL